MTYHIHITKTAEQDMVNAADYIEFVLKNPDAADKLLSLAEEKINSLGSFPRRFEPVNDAFLSALGLHAISVNNYLAFFIISDSEKVVTIVRFLYEKRDWRTILGLGFSSE